MRHLQASILCTSLMLAGSANGADITVYAAGDIAECPDGPESSGAAQTARLIPDGATVFVLGDSAYPLANRETLEACYGPTWGRFREHTFAVAGNHDYVAGSARDFLDYFGERTPQRTWFREPVGDWWLIGLDSDLRGAALRRQQHWLEQQLEAIRDDGRCIVAMWHHALFSTGFHKHDGRHMQPAWAALDAASADIVLSGHEHFYESFEPLDAQGRPHASGIREFVVGTGGAHLRDLSFSPRHRAFARVHGVLELALRPDDYSYTFRTVDGEVRDHGVVPCRRAPQSMKLTAVATRAATASAAAASDAPRASTASAPRPSGTITPR